MTRIRFGFLILCILLNASSWAQAQQGVDVATPEGLPVIGKWMLTAKGVPSDWLGEIDRGKNLREPINVIIIDEGAASAEDAKARC